MNRLDAKRKIRNARKKRVRRQIQGTASRPRLTVYRSLRHIYAQIVDDVAGHTIVAASTVGRDLRDGIESTSNLEAAKAVGRAIGAKAIAKEVSKVVFDRNGFAYHGKVKALADAAREAGLEF